MWSKNNIIILFVLSMTLILASCTNDKEDLLYGNDECESSAVSFSQDIVPIISNHCATVGCHVQGGGGTGIFENYNQIKSKVDDNSFEARVIDQRDMPPSGPLSDCQIEHIIQWLEDGAPNN